MMNNPFLKVSENSKQDQVKPRIETKLEKTFSGVKEGKLKGEKIIEQLRMQRTK